MTTPSLKSVNLDAPRTFRELMALYSDGTDAYFAASPNYPWGRLYGGQVVAQALRAAYETVDSAQRVHSLHAYFVRGGIPAKTVRFEVDRLRDGRSFTTRRVVAHQEGGGAILSLDASFQVVENDVDLQQVALPLDVPEPANVREVEWTAIAELREPERGERPGRSWVWLRVKQDLGDDGALHDCALAYLSDHNAIDAIVSAHPKAGQWDDLMVASLDHNIWFHRRVRADDWLLFDLRAQDLTNARGLGIGAVHSVSGVHAATVAQEGLVRSPRTG